MTSGMRWLPTSNEVVKSHRSSLTVASAGEKAHSLNPMNVMIVIVAAVAVAAADAANAENDWSTASAADVKDDETAASDRIDARVFFESLSLPKTSEIECKLKRTSTTAHKCHGAMKISSTDFVVKTPLNYKPMFGLRQWTHWTSRDTSELSALTFWRCILKTAIIGVETLAAMLDGTFRRRAFVMVGWALSSAWLRQMGASFACRGIGIRLPIRPISSRYCGSR